MTDPKNAPHSERAAPTVEIVAEAPPLRGWKRVRFILKVIEIRLRFIIILLATFVLVGNWDWIKNRWDKLTRPSADAVQPTSDVEYFCPMHPTVVRESLEPDGSWPKCPICNMPLSKRKKGATDKRGELPAGVTARVQLSPERIQMAGIATAEAAYRPLVKEIRTVGFVDYDQSRQSRIVSRVAGYLDKLYVDKSYQSVSEGEPLASIYSPELYSTEQELILALNRGAADLVEAGKERLKLLGVGLSEIEQIVSSRKAGPGLVIRSPVNGHVIDKLVVQGAHVEAGATLFEVADLSDVWVEAEIYEADIPLLRAGQMAEVTVEGLPNRVFQGKITLVHPHVEMLTRTNRVRIELPNPGHALRPGMYATVAINIPYQDIEPFKSHLGTARQGPKGNDDASLIAFQQTCPVTGNKLGSMGDPVKRQVDGKTVFLCCPACIDKFDAGKDRYLAALKPPPAKGVLTVPEAAVVDTGTKRIVYVEREPGVFDGVEVELGPRSEIFTRL